MTTYELNRIILDEERLSLDRIKDILYELKTIALRLGKPITQLASITEKLMRFTLL